MAPAGIDADDVARARGWLEAVEAELVARAMGRADASAGTAAAALTDAHRGAGLCGVAAKFLAVGTPRTFALVGAGARARELLAAQTAYAAPREVRVHEPAAADDAAAAAIAASLASPTVSARAVTLAQACASDIVVIAAPVTVPRALVRAGTLVTVLDRGATIDPALLAAAHVYTIDDRATAPDGVRVHATLAAVTAGLVDGRTLDEITLLLA